MAESIRRPRRSKSHRTPQNQPDPDAYVSTRCFYCDNQFGTIVRRNGRIIDLQPVWDHIVPFSVSRNNGSSNLVRCCRLCNILKRDLVFDSVDEIRAFLLARWMSIVILHRPKYIP